MVRMVWFLGLFIACTHAPPAAAPSAPAPAASHGHYATVHGLKMYYAEYGSPSATKTLVLLCGGSGWVEFWPSPLEYFSGEYRVIAPEPMGHGRSADDPSRPFHYHDLAEDTAELLHQLHVEHAYIVGWSQGGILGLDLAMNHPALVTKLVVSGANFTADGMEPEAFNWIRDVKAADWPFIDGYAKLSPDGAAHFPIFFERVRKMWIEEPSYTAAQLATIKSPTMIVVGDHDMIKIEHTVALFHAIPDSRLWIVPGSGHMVPNERAPLFNRTVADFFNAH